jgi:hypothetical protein
MEAMRFVSMLGKWCNAWTKCGGYSMRDAAVGGGVNAKNGRDRIIERRDVWRGSVSLIT